MFRIMVKPYILEFPVSDKLGVNSAGGGPEIDPPPGGRVVIQE